METGVALPVSPFLLIPLPPPPSQTPLSTSLSPLFLSFPLSFHSFHSPFIFYLVPLSFHPSSILSSYFSSLFYLFPLSFPSFLHPFPFLIPLSIPLPSLSHPSSILPFFTLPSHSSPIPSSLPFILLPPLTSPFIPRPRPPCPPPSS